LLIKMYDLTKREILKKKKIVTSIITL